MKKGQLVEVDIVKMAFPSTGIGYIEGKEIHIKNAVRGQRVRARILKNKEKYIEGKLIEIIERSPVEIEAFCPHYGECGGCLRQTFPYEEQLKLKADMVKELLDEKGIKNYEFLGIEASPEVFGYRNKMQYTFGDETKGGELTFGMHKRGLFNSVVTVDRCRLVDEDFNLILKTSLDYFREKELPHYNKKNHSGYLRHLVIRKGIKTGEILVGIVTSTQIKEDLTPYSIKLKELDLKGKLVGVIHVENDGLADTVQSDRTEILWGRDYFFEELLGLKFKIYPFSFFQTNSLGAEVLYETVLNFIEDLEDKKVFDLYCGTGTIGQILAKKAKWVYGIELVEEAVKAAKENAEMNGLTNCTFVAGDVFERLNEFNETPDIIVVDPPRGGIHPKALEKIMKFDAKEIIYVSCNPKTLVENLQQMTSYGYEVKKVKCVDLFPHTAHVETVVLLSHKKADDFISIKMDYAEGMPKFPDRITYKLI